MAAALCINASKNSLFLLLAFLLLTLLVGFSSARPAPATMAVAAHKTTHRTRSFLPAVPNTAFRYGHQIFSFLPKGTPVPPSAPSKRHNSVVNSAPRD